MPFLFNDTQNKNIVNNIQDILKLNPITDVLPKQVLPTIQPVFEVSPTQLISSVDDVFTTTGTKTLLTTSSTQDTYVTGIILSIAKDAANDMATGHIRLRTTIKGAVHDLISAPILTLTAQSFNSNREFSVPIRLDRGTAISVVGASFTAGLMSFSASVQFYTSDAGNNLSV